MTRASLSLALFASSGLALLACGSSSGSSGGTSTTGTTGGTGGTGGVMCFSPLSGPSDPSCAAYPLGMTCGYGDEPAYSCTCVEKSGAKVWDCAQSGPGSSSSTGAGGAGCHGDSAAWDAIKAHALDCQKNSDCCVVINSCVNEAQIVTAADSAAAGAAWPYCDSLCNDCIPPAIEVACVSGKCVGENVGSASPPPPDSLRMNHCGVDPTTVNAPAATAHFTCGG